MCDIRCFTVTGAHPSFAHSVRKALVFSDSVVDGENVMRRYIQNRNRNVSFLYIHPLCKIFIELSTYYIKLVVWRIEKKVSQMSLGSIKAIWQKEWITHIHVFHGYVSLYGKWDFIHKFKTRATIIKKGSWIKLCTRLVLKATWIIKELNWFESWTWRHTYR